MLFNSIQDKIFLFVVIICLIILIYYSSFNNDLEIRKLNPPKIMKNNFGERILCYRPLRLGTPNMSVESYGEKTIAHNYGHGGSGWTLGPGSAKYVNDILISYKNIKNETPITIIGGGVIGLFSAYDLLNKNYKNITIVAEEFDNLTSHKAGGLLAPVSMNNEPEMQIIIDKIGIDGYKFYSEIAKSQNKDFQNSALIVPAYFESREESGLEPYVGIVMKPAKDVILDFQNGMKRKMVAYDDGIYIDTILLMKQLKMFLEKHNIKFVKKRINSFDEIKDNIIINCTGLGARELNNDLKVDSVQGHLIMMKDQVPEDLQYMIFANVNEGETKTGQKIKRSFYLFPKMSGTSLNDIGVLGGTFIENSYEDTPNIEEFDNLIDNMKKFYGLS
jgi:D-amino-acid oxidase